MTQNTLGAGRRIGSMDVNSIMKGGMKPDPTAYGSPGGDPGANAPGGPIKTGDKAMKMAGPGPKTNAGLTAPKVPMKHGGKAKGMTAKIPKMPTGKIAMKAPVDGTTNVMKPKGMKGPKF